MCQNESSKEFVSKVADKLKENADASAVIRIPQSDKFENQKSSINHMLQNQDISLERVEIISDPDVKVPSTAIINKGEEKKK